MKTISNKSETITINGQDRTLITAELLKECMNVIPDKGLDVADIAARLKVIKVIDDVIISKAESFQLEDADYNKAVECVKLMKWAIVHQFVIDFSDQFNGTKIS